MLQNEISVSITTSLFFLVQIYSNIAAPYNYRKLFFSLSDNLSLTVTATRNCVGVWDLRIGKLIAKLADSPLGAIVTHAIITQDGK